LRQKYEVKRQKLFIRFLIVRGAQVIRAMEGEDLKQLSKKKMFRERKQVG